MEVVIAAVGRLKAGPERDLCDRYLDRARKGGTRLGLKGFSVEEIGESRASRPADRIAEEEALLLARLGAADRVVALDPQGRDLGSDEIARALQRDAEAAVPRRVFVIGGPDGLGQSVRHLAAHTMAFGRATWPHQLVRILLAEQLYRATTILTGHPYHRA